MKKIFRLFFAFLLILFFNIKISFGQDIKINPNVEISIQNDTLNDLSYDELRSEFMKLWNKQDTAAYKKLSVAYLEKAKREQNTERKIIGYSMMHHTTNLNDAVIYLDSIFPIAVRLEDKKKWPAQAYFFKGAIFYDLRKFDLALSEFLEGLEYAKKYNNEYQIAILNNSLGLLKLERVGEYKNALKFNKEAFNFYNDDEKRTRYDYDYLVSIYVLAENHFKLKELDSSTYYTELGLKESIKYNLEDLSGYFHLIESSNEYLRNNYTKSIELLEKSKKVILEENDIPNYIIYNYYSALNYQKKGDINKYEEHLLRIDSLYILKPLYSEEIRNTYERLVSLFKEKDDLKNQLYYVNRLLHIDSIYINDYENVSKVFYEEYDNKLLLSEKEKINKRLNRSNTSNKFLISIIILALIILGSIINLLYRRNKLMMVRFDEISSGKEIKKTNHSSNIKPDISDTIFDEICDKLKKFEDNKGFLENDLFSSDLSKILKSNAKYVRQVIKYKHNVSITNYINNLRIEYAINKLNNERQFKHYKLASIANESGFNQSRTFNDAFYKKTNIKASFYISELIKKDADSKN